MPSVTQSAGRNELRISHTLPIGESQIFSRLKVVKGEAVTRSDQSSSLRKFMKPNKNPFCCFPSFTLPALVTLLTTHQGFAVDRYWDQNGALSGMGGTGTWNSSSSFWRTESGASSNGGTLGAWASYATDAATHAILSGTGGTLSTTEAIVTNKLSVNSGSFIISNGTGGSFSFNGNDRAISVASGATLTLSPVISGGVGLAISGGGTTTFSAANRAYGASLTVTGAETKVVFGATNGLSASGASSSHSFGVGTTLQLNGTNNYYSTLTLNGASLDLNNSAALVLQNLGGITVTGAQAVIRSVMTGGNVAGMTLQSTGRGMNIGNTSHVSGVDLDLSADLKGAGNFNKTGAGTLRLSGNNTFGSGTLTFGNTTENRGYIRLASNSALGGLGTINLAATGTGISGLQIEGNVSINQSLSTVGRSNSNTSGYVLRNISGNNAWNGGINITNGGGSYGFISDSGTLTLGGDLQSTYVSSFAARNVIFSGDGSFNITGGLLGGGPNSENLTIAKNGAGSLTLGGSNTYTGDTSINSGTLSLTSTASLGNTSTSIAEGATLSGGGSIGGAVTINGTHAPGFSPGTQTFEAGLSYTSTSTLEWELTNNASTGRGTDYDAVNVTGGNFALNPLATLDLTFSGSVDFLNAFWSSSQQWLVVDLNGATAADSNSFVLGSISGGQNYTPSLGDFGILRQPGSTSQNSVYLTWTPVPEPRAALLGGLGILMLLRRKK